MITGATYNQETYTLIIHTDFIGKDKYKRSMCVSGIPNIENAKEFIHFMGFNLTELLVIAKEGITNERI